NAFETLPTHTLVFKHTNHMFHHTILLWANGNVMLKGKFQFAHLDAAGVPQRRVLAFGMSQTELAPHQAICMGRVRSLQGWPSCLNLHAPKYGNGTCECLAAAASHERQRFHKALS